MTNARAGWIPSGLAACPRGERAQREDHVTLADHDVLADALEEAGCDDARFLDWCRQEQH